MSYASHSEGWKRLSHHTYNILLYLLNSNAIAVPHIKQPKDDMFPTHTFTLPLACISPIENTTKTKQPKPLNFKPSAYTINQPSNHSTHESTSTDQHLRVNFIAPDSFQRTL